MNHKILRWSLGSLVVTAPLASVIACSGPTDGLTDEEYKKRLADLTSEDAQLLLETRWLLMVLKENGIIINEKTPWESQKILELIKFYIATQIAKDANYLYKIGTKASGIIRDGKQVYISSDLAKWGLLNDYVYGYTQAIEDNIINISKVLMLETSLGFANKIYQNLLIENYLSIDKAAFANYWKLQYDREFNFTAIQNLINDGKNFLLVQNVLEQKLFLKWEVQEKIAANRWVDEKYRSQKIDSALQQFVVTTNQDKTIADLSNTNIKKQKLVEQIWNIPPFPIKIDEETSANVTLKDYVGYQGAIGQKSASGKLDFSEVSLKDASEKTYWTGILKEDEDEKLNELVIQGIDFSDVKDILKGKLTLLFGIMPLYKDGKLTMDGSFFDDKLDKVAWQLYANNEKIYSDAMKYYADEKKKGGQDLKLTIENPDILHIWKDVKKLIYVKAK